MPANFRSPRESGLIWESFMSKPLCPDAMPIMTSNSAGFIVKLLLPIMKHFSSLSLVLIIFSTPDFVPLMQVAVTDLLMKGRRKW